MKKTVVGLSLLLAMSVANAENIFDFKKSIKLFPSLIPINFNNLPMDDQRAIDRILERVSTYYAFCNGSMFVQSIDSPFFEEVKDYENRMLFQKINISKADRMNGMTWSGKVYLMYQHYGHVVYRVGKGSWSIDEPAVNSPTSFTFQIFNGDLLEIDKHTRDMIDPLHKQLTCEDTIPRDTKPKDTSRLLKTPRTVAGLNYIIPPIVKYPEAALGSENGGKTVIRALVNINGNVDEVVVQLSSGNNYLDKEALRAVKKARFEPYNEDGIAQAIYVLIPISFVLPDK